MRQTDGGKPTLINQTGDKGQGGQNAALGNNQDNGRPEQIVLSVQQPVTPDKPADTKASTKTEQPEPLQIRDVTAQEDMVFWAMWMFVAALATFIVTSIGTFLIWRQIKLTRQAVEDTGEATKAMREGNEIAREAMSSGNRAWIEISIVSLGDLRCENDEFRMKVVFQIKNIGKSVALNVDPVAEIMADPTMGNRTMGEISGPLRRFYEALKSSPPELGAHALFPDRDTTQEWEVAVQANDVEITHDGKGTGLHPMCVVLGVRYNSIFDRTRSESHHTVEVGHIRRIDEQGRPGIVVVGRAGVPAKELRLVRPVESLGSAT